MRLAAALLSLLAVLALAPPARAGFASDGPPPVAPPADPDETRLRGVVRDAWLGGRVATAQERRWRGDVRRARAALQRLEGSRRAELAAVLGRLRADTASGALTVSRMPLAFLTLRRNVTQWRVRPLPASGARVTFGRDPSVFQYVPGQGMQFHALATAGRANALVKPCLAREQRQRARGGRPRGQGCHERRLATVLDRLVATASLRGGFRAWEYRYDFGGGTAPWISAMTQATAAQALARGFALLGEEDYRDTALAALGAFDAPPPVGVALRAERSREYLMYSFSSGLHVLNGFLQAVIGLHDVAELTGSPRAKRLYELGERAARDAVAAYDTGAWTRYSLDGREATLDYHELVTDFAGGLCERTGEAVYCDGAARFARYLEEPPAIHIDAPARGHEDRDSAFSFRLSKVSDVVWEVRGPRGAVASNRVSLPRGTYPVTWTPPEGGAYRVVVRATGPEGLTGRAHTDVRVRHTRKPCRSTSPRRPPRCTPRSKRSTRRNSTS